MGSRTGPVQRREGKPDEESGFLSPLPGLDALRVALPRLTPWAILCRRSAAHACFLEGFKGICLVSTLAAAASFNSGMQTTLRFAPGYLHSLSCYSTSL